MLLLLCVFVNSMKNCEVFGSPQGREGTKAREESVIGIESRSSLAPATLENN